MKYTTIFTIILFYTCVPITQEKMSQEYTKVTNVIDGDTYDVEFNDSIYVIRLAHIDCPEHNQPYSKGARRFGINLCLNKKVKIVSDGSMDKYGRLIAEIWLDSICLNKELVRNGFAWYNYKYSDEKEYGYIEQFAERNRIGLWKDSLPIAPWNWRKEHLKIYQ